MLAREARRPPSSLILLLGVLAASASASPSSSSLGSFRHLSKRQSSSVPDLTFDTISTTDPSGIDGQIYDYIIVGGGTAALAVAARLAEANNATSVLVIEAGSDGDAAAARILPPANAYFNGIAYPSSPYDWGYYTSNQTDLDSREVFWPRGKLLGGSSAVNGVYMTRASEGEHNAWASLYNSTTWDFPNVLPYYKKHETFDAPSSAYSSAVGGIVVDQANHGTNGPIHYSQAGYLYSQIDNWIPTFANLGVSTGDPASGVTTGAYISTSAIRASDQTRSYSRVGYFPSKISNVDILTGYQVTRVNLNSSGSTTTATGVTFKASNDGTAYAATSNKEVILAAGVIGSPQLLQLSGVGPADLLNGLGIDVVVDLPGVGAQLSDHLSTSITFSTTAPVTGDLIKSNTTFNDTQWSLWVDGNGDQSVYSAPNEAVAYLNLSTVFGGSDAAASYITALQANVSNYMAGQGLAGTVGAGYRAISEAEITQLLQTGEAAVEVLMANTGYNSGQSGKTMTIQFALQHPMSRGWVNITSTNPFVMPSIDPGYLTHPGDIAIIRQAMKYARKVAATTPLSSILGGEIAPGTDVSTDAQIDEYVRSALSTEYHPAGSCAMLPLDLGGVVDESLRVHGVNNLRVIDSSVIPIGVAAHLTSPTYAIAEKGAAILLGTDIVSTKTGSNSTASSSNTATSTKTTSALGIAGLANGGSTSSSAPTSPSNGAAARLASPSLLAASAIIAGLVARFLAF